MAKKEFEEKTVEAENKNAVFSKEQLLGSKRFSGRKDIINALLDPDKQYTVEAAETLIENYMKGKVK